MLGKYLKINGELMPNPVSGTWSDQLNPKENIYETEAGTRKSNIIRLDRPSWSCSFNCTSAMKERIQNYCKLESIVCEVDGQEFEGTLRLSGACTMVKDSEYCRDTKGLWVVPVVFEGE